MELAVAAVLVSGMAGVSTADTPALRFARGDDFVAALDVAELAKRCGAETVVVQDDPYYGKRKTFRACPLRAVLALGFGDETPAPDGSGFLLRALDGYVKLADADLLAEPGAYLAFADLRGDSGARPNAAAAPLADPNWEPIGRARVDPGPLYLVWTGGEQNDTHRYPWPYQLAAIEIASFEARHPHTVPLTATNDAPAWAGFEIFRRECFACHAVNGEGGRIGPELNVPRSIVEYRPAAQIKAYIRDPASFRYTSMPAHRHLSAGDLDALVAYFTVMKDLKHDPTPGAADDG